MQNKYHQLAPIKSTQYTYEDVEVIIGQDYYHAVKPIEFILRDDKNSPCSVRLPIGWVISGPLPPSVNSTSSCFKCVVEDSSLIDQIKSWYELESYGAFKQVDARSDADIHVLSILNSETVHNGEPHDPRKRSDREWYLPHHPVVNPNKPCKVRRVLNGASNFHGTSLNKSLLVGLDLLQNLNFVLLRFRQHKYAISADIEGMFLQVGVLARDQTSLRFLWREDTTSDVVVQQYTRHMFGARDSPTCANFALRKTATDNMFTYPEAASVVTEKFYMDDYLYSFENVTHAIKFSRNLVSLLKLGEFNLTKFVSNADEITYTVRARLLLKDIWKISGQSWDDELPQRHKR